MSLKYHGKFSDSKEDHSWSTEHSASLSFSSDLSKTRKVTTFGTTVRWKSNFQFIMIAMACTVSVTELSAFTSTEKTQGTTTKYISFTISPLLGVTIYHYITIFALVVLPVYYMNVILGQYTQLGLVLLKYLNPMCRGVTFSFVINMMLKLIKNSMLIGDYGIYFLTILIGDMQWLSCPPKLKDTCWSVQSDCKKNCLDEKRKMSAEIYYVQVFLRNPVTDMKNVGIGRMPAAKLVFLLSTWFAFVVMLTTVTSSFFRLRKLFLIASLILTFLLLIKMSVDYGKTDNIADLFDVSTEKFLNLHAWAAAAKLCINIMALGRAFHMFHGSYMSPAAPADLLTLAVSTIVFILTAACSLVSITAWKMIVKHGNLDKEHENHIHFADTTYYNFVIIPQALSFMRLAKFWTLVYFGSIVLLLVSNQLSHIVLAEKTISDRYPTLIRYRKYTNCVICIICALCGMLLMSKEAYLLKRAILFKLDSFLETFNCFVLCFIVCWIYGVQKLSDDIHFLTGSQPPKFWKICWYCMPCITGSVHIYFVYLHYGEAFIIENILYFIFIAPVPIVAFIEVFRYIKNRNLLGIFHSEERFGPPDPQERLYRRVYNPRKEIRFRRKTDICFHGCLLSSKILKRVISEETRFKKEYSKQRRYEEMASILDDADD